MKDQHKKIEEGKTSRGMMKRSREGEIGRGREGKKTESREQKKSSKLVNKLMSRGSLTVQRQNTRL